MFAIVPQTSIARNQISHSTPSIRRPEGSACRVPSVPVSSPHDQKFTVFAERASERDVATSGRAMRS